MKKSWETLNVVASRAKVVSYWFLKIEAWGKGLLWSKNIAEWKEKKLRDGKKKDVGCGDSRRP